MIKEIREIKEVGGGTREEVVAGTKSESYARE